jgi:hypothetical protein
MRVSLLMVSILVAGAVAEEAACEVDPWTADDEVALLQTVGASLVTKPQDAHQKRLKDHHKHKANGGKEAPSDSLDGLHERHESKHGVLHGSHPSMVLPSKHKANAGASPVTKPHHVLKDVLHHIKTKAQRHNVTATATRNGTQEIMKDLFQHIKLDWHKSHQTHVTAQIPSSTHNGTQSLLAQELEDDNYHNFRDYLEGMKIEIIKHKKAMVATEEIVHAPYSGYYGDPFTDVETIHGSRDEPKSGSTHSIHHS